MLLCRGAALEGAALCLAQCPEEAPAEAAGAALSAEAALQSWSPLALSPGLQLCWPLCRLLQAAAALRPPPCSLSLWQSETAAVCACASKQLVQALVQALVQVLAQVQVLPLVLPLC